MNTSFVDALSTKNPRLTMAPTYGPDAPETTYVETRGWSSIAHFSDGFIFAFAISRNET
jgi:hypothetical protein